MHTKGASGVMTPFTTDFDLFHGIMKDPERYVVRRASDMRGHYADPEALERLIALGDPVHYEVFERIVPDAEGKVQYHYVILDYLARWVSGEPCASDEVLESRWVEPEEFSAYAMTRGTAEVILRMLETARKTGVL